MQEAIILESKYKILIVDDEPGNRQLLRQILTDRYKLFFAKNGATAISLVEKAKPDLILLDIVMPDMDGYEVCHRIKTNPATANIPVIFISSLTDINKKISAFKNGGVDYICNPFQSDEVLARVQTHLNLYGLQKELELSNNKYIWLYDFAPVGYFSINRKTEIVEVNLTGANMLGGKKEDLTTRHLSMFVKDEDRVTFNEHIEGLFDCNQANHTACNIAMSDLQGRDLWVTLEGTAVDGDICLVVLIDITSKRILATEVDKLQLALSSSVESILGRSPAAHKLYKDILQVAQSNLSVLLLGETGCGKSFVAEIIHNLSHRSEKPFVKVDISALSKELIESELFGHEKGAFTGAVMKTKGFFEASSGGTIFLDEIQNIPLHLQSKLLTVIDDKKIYPVGNTRSVDVDLRIICASNVDIYSFVKQGTFRSDLYYRLNEFSLTIPPLRERVEDISFYAQKFLNDTCYELGKPLFYMTGDALESLRRHQWPGNIRELKNLMRRIVLFCENENISSEYVRRLLNVDGNVTDKTRHVSLKEILEKTELESILAAIEEANGNKTKAAAMLGITYRWLARRLKYYGIAPMHGKHSS
ncbi:sigma-54-dependent Fis family transcriptional regulator [Candidatus Magnetobacterium casense]|uniref:DNA-binding transcriptional regulator NtrC n=1 Tax=Candidatus Magnetobacterium casense TaxID=1455061 RepID=A0ABS6RWA2_9BACT|nr:sigma-54-dependent Fis family transcriptional regulator [Candidatus Magnetobacterium casensis]MBV6340909.1 sigma-54-dependent Fis family transcriptional regulator [Candidatus Magnetobacterium casensis]